MILSVSHFSRLCLRIERSTGPESSLSSAAVNLSTPLRDLSNIPAQRVKQLERFGLLTVGDLVTHFPRRWEDRTQFDRWPSGESEEPVCVCGVVAKVISKRMRGRMKITEVVLEEEGAHALSTRLVCRWFNAYWVEKVVATGQMLVVYGKTKRRAREVVIDHPEFEVAEEDSGEPIHLKRITPIHRATEGLTTRVLRRLIWDVLQQLPANAVPSLMPESLDRMPRAEALRQIHFPESQEALAKARQHLVLEEFFAMQLLVGAKHAEHGAQPGQDHTAAGALMARFHQTLPFALTGAQQRAIEEIRRDLAAPRTMNRLLHGDVGAGKTLVALSAMLQVVEAGYQAALMAPTQILAEQHYLTAKRLLSPLGVRVALRTGARKEESTDPLFDHQRWMESVKGAPGAERPIYNSEPQILIGTHALLYEGAGFTRLGLAVIDEQHKFGVLQRAKLREQGGPGMLPDVLVMTATPIPRTLTMSLYGDLDVSVLDELPKGRGKIITAVRNRAKMPEAVKFLKEHLEKGRQAYIVYPLIDQSERLEAKAAAAEYEKWRELLAPMPCELLHGRIPPDKKDAIMERFRIGTTKALIATTVIEVGIDVPNANIMLIENAERFGLAQLHQLRGRIGRGEHKSYCVLITESEDPEAIEKLRVLEETVNGFEIADADLRLRGPGDILGTQQSGLPPLKLGDILRDGDLMRKARGAAFLLLERDPQLMEPGHAHYRALLAQTRKLTLAQVS
ncbi:MAG: ATP-dependent DNA helicase RecG [Chthoniobacteraceae bacterium]